MLRPTDQGNYLLQKELTAEELARLRLALTDVTMEILRVDPLSEDGVNGLHELLLFFRPCLLDEIEAQARQ